MVRIQYQIFKIILSICKKKHGEDIDKPSVQIYANKIENRVSFKINIVNNDYQQDSRVLHTFVPNKSFGSLLGISPTHHIFLKTFNWEYDESIVWFTDQNSKALEIEHRISLTMVIK